LFRKRLFNDDDEEEEEEEVDKADGGFENASATSCSGVIDESF
jgi:hypothetical protein